VISPFINCDNPLNEPPKFHALPRTENRIVQILIVLITLAGAAAAFKGQLRSLDLFFYDSLTTMVSPEVPQDRGITIVDIDDVSLANAGQWPWPRYRLARLLGILAQARPSAMAMDILFPEPDRLSLARIKEQFKTDFQLDIGFQNVPDSLTDNDGFFGHILGQTQTIGARYFYFDHATTGEVCKGGGLEIEDGGGLEDIPRASGALCNTPKLEMRLTGAGFINNQYDRDGLLRKTPLLIRHRSGLFPHLALALYMAEQGLTRLETGRDRLGPYLKAGNAVIPVTGRGFAHMRFEGSAGRFPTISALDVLNRNFDPALVRGRAILIGSSAVGLKDIHPTVFDPHFPGIEVSAVLLDNIHRSAFFRIPDKGPHGAAVVCLALGATMLLIFSRRPTPLALLAGSAAWAGGSLALVTALFQFFGIYVSPSAPLVLALVLFVLLSFIRFAAEKQAAFTWFRHLSAAQNLTMQIMVDMVETRDPETGEHIVRTQHYARAVALRLRQKGLFREVLTDEYIHTLFLSVPLHDIGKVGIPDRILLKPGRLTEGEFRHMKLHAVYGRTILRQAADKIEGSNYLAMGEDIAGTHHEKWDGTGYPRGLSGEEIPLSGRIMAIADVYDALISKRCYKPPFTHEKAMSIILEEKGKLFDPVVVDAFLDIEDQVVEIAGRFGDEEA
jgi:HD-GYP domain-containing protein (c-di-GMP phosphodiesterase class II)